MRVVRDRAALREARSQLDSPVGLVPTMGALHAGHTALIERARADNASVIASLFVNPTQFAPGEDHARYPRDEPRDLESFAAAGVDLVFAPSVGAVYPPGWFTTVDVGRLGEVLEGAIRPGHFRGVATVVTILLSLARPDRAYFGQKDGQQTVVVRRLVADLGLPVEIIVCPTVREPDGLALSSRNAYLSGQERVAAPVLWRALDAARSLFDSGERDADALRAAMRRVVGGEALAELQYASVADLETLEEVEQVSGRALASVAARFPSARLIDCVELDATPSGLDR